MATAQIEAKAKRPPQTLHLKKILVPLDFSSPSKQAFKYAVKFAQEFGAGLAAHEIVEAAKELDVDLIVIATHGYTGWKHFAIGSTAKRVVRAAPCPVLVVREKEHDFL